MSSRLRHLGDRAGATGEFFRRVARLLLDQHRERFLRSPWLPLDPDTVRRKARQGQDPRILRVTGTLERALTVWGAPGQKLQITPDELVFGLEQSGAAYYGVFHQRGEGVPKREVVKATQATRRRVAEALRDHLFGRL